MRAALIAKFSQHADLGKELITTGKTYLVESSQSDAFWGTGKNGKGKNMLGMLLMEVRTVLIERSGEK